MKTVYALLLMLVTNLSFKALHGQTIPFGACGLQYTYDASGNLLQRQYVCVTAFHKNIDVKILLAQSKGVGVGANQTAFLHTVDALYTKKENGILSLYFDRKLNKVPVDVIDVDGKKVLGLIWNGSVSHSDLSKLNAGDYTIVAHSSQLQLSQKVVKL